MGATSLPVPGMGGYDFLIGVLPILGRRRNGADRGSAQQIIGVPVLKKAGIVVAVAATGLLVTTPIASAATAPAQVSNNCSSTQSGGTITQVVTGGSGLLVGGAAAAAAAPVTTQTQALNCTAVNISDLVNANSGNTTSSSVRTRIQNSFNRTFIFRR
jgi:hypothetical protein